jgi:multicomponent Na+:H+ antiporter subunit G
VILEQAANVISGILILAGAFFYVVGGIGLVRMPDIFTRIHGASVLDTVGGSLMLVGMMIAGGFSLVTIKLVIILAVIIFTSPVATHALAQAAIHAGVEPQLASKDILGDAPQAQTVRKMRQARPAAAKKQVARKAAGSMSTSGRTTGKAKSTARKTAGSKGRTTPSKS